MNMTSKLSVSSVILAAVLSQQAIAADNPQPRVRGSQHQVNTAAAHNGLGLPAAKPGQCFAKVKLPATYKSQQRRILIQKASATRKLVRAPQYRWINKKVLVRKPVYKTRAVPAQYKTVNKRVMVKPAYNTWRKGHGAITRIDNMTGQIMCRVTIPAVYRYIQQNVLVRPAKTIRTLVPAVYKTVKQKRLVAPAQYRTVHKPARYKTQNYRIKTGASRYVWRSILCQTNAPRNYRQAPKNYRQAVVRNKPVVRNNRTNYRSSGISYQDYLKVMRAGPVKARVAKPMKRVIKKRVTAPTKKYSNIITPQEYRAVMSTKQANKSRPIVKKVRTTISQREYQAVMRAQPARKAKPAVKQARRAMPVKKYSGVISQQEYYAVMKSRPVNMTKAAKRVNTTYAPKTRAAVTQTRISQQEYTAVMRAKVPVRKVAKVVSKPVVKEAPVKQRYKLVTKKRATKKVAKTSNKKVGIVYGIQKALLAKGFDPGSMDGKMGASTAAALKAFQSSRGLPIGQLNKDTFRALGLIR